jgi:hypothetical protein
MKWIGSKLNVYNVCFKVACSVNTSRAKEALGDVWWDHGKVAH